MPNLTLYTFLLYIPTAAIQSRSFFFVGLKNETKDLPATADWFFNIDHCLACVCSMQYEISHE